MANILEKYEKLSQLDTDFSDIKFEEEKYCISLSGGVDSEEWSDLLNKKIIMDESTGLIRTEIIKCKDGSVDHWSRRAAESLQADADLEVSSSWACINVRREGYYSR